MFPFPFCGGIISPWRFIAAGTTGTGVNPVAAVPAGIAAGDLLVMVSSTRGAYTTPPAGWIDHATDVGATVKLSVWSKIASSSESNVNLTNGSLYSAVAMFAYRNISASPLDKLGTVVSDATSPYPTTTLTTTVANDLVMSIWAVDHDSGNVITAPANTTVRLSLDPDYLVCGMLIVDENQGTVGATTSRSASTTANIATTNIAIAFKQSS